MNDDDDDDVYAGSKPFFNIFVLFYWLFYLIELLYKQLSFNFSS